MFYKSFFKLFAFLKKKGVSQSWDKKSKKRPFAVFQQQKGSQNWDKKSKKRPLSFNSKGEFGAQGTRIGIPWLARKRVQQKEIRMKRKG